MMPFAFFPLFFIMHVFVRRIESSLLELLSCTRFLYNRSGEGRAESFWRGVVIVAGDGDVRVLIVDALNCRL